MTIHGSTLNPADGTTGSGSFPNETFAPNLANGNLTLVGANRGFGRSAVRSTGSASSGFITFQATNAVPGNSTTALCLISAAAALNTFALSGTGGFLWFTNGTTSLNGAAGPAMPSWSNTGDVAVLCVNLTTLQAWGQVNGGPWNGSTSAFPSLGTGSVSLAGIGGAAPFCAGGYMVDNGGTPSQETFAFTAADGVAPAPPSTLLVWARGMYQIPGTQEWAPGNWTNVFAGSVPGGPELNQGGLSMGGPKIVPGTPLYLTAQGTGDGSLTLQSGPPFRVVPPRGFAWGWPNGSGAPGDVFDPATLKGSAVLLSGGLTVSFPTNPGLVQSKHGVKQGSYYIEFTTAGDIFSQALGVGFGRSGPDLTAWHTGGGFSSSDHNGGAYVTTGTQANGYQGSLAANTIAGPVIPDFKVPPPLAVGMAVTIMPGDFALSFQPAPFQPVPLVCLPCTELVLPRQRFTNRFGA